MQAFPKEKLEAVLKAACRNDHTDFYRSRLPNIPFPLTEDAWAAMPSLPREEITPVSMWERVHVPREEVHYIRNSYGTSGKRILITPRISYGDYTEPYKTLGVTRMLNFFASAYFDFPQAHNGVVSLFGDVADLTLASHIAKRLNIDAIYLAPFTALVFGDLLAERGIAGNIKMVQLCGERCSPLQFEILRKQYPNAAIISNYSSSETREAVAYPCVHDLKNGGSLRIQSVPEFYCEILDEAGQPIEAEGVYGELVLTSLTPQVPFPFIRYRTSDVAAWVKRSCGCDEHARAFEIIGRLTVFPVRLIKGELTVDAVERALADCGVPLSYFEIHYTDEAAGSKTLPRVTIKLASERPLDAGALARDVEQKLKVYPTYTYAQGVAAGIYLPIEISLIEKPQSKGKGLTPVVVRHFSGDASATRTGSAAAARV